MKKAVVFALTGIMAVSMFGCGSKKQVEVSSVDDLKDLTIGVQTGTTGDSYASDAVASDSQMKRYNKGADAIQALKTGNRRKYLGTGRICDLSEKRKYRTDRENECGHQGTERGWNSG